MKRYNFPMVLGLLILIANLALAGDNLQTSLINAWEEIQKNDRQTLVFEKLEPGRYTFHTTRFPFEGELRVLNVSIEDTPMFDDFGGYSTGMVEIELLDLPDDFIDKYAYSYTNWQQNNFLYLDSETNKWLSSKEWQSTAFKKSQGWQTFASWSGYFWILILLVIVGFLWLVFRKSSAQMKKAMEAQKKALADSERAIQLSERAIKLTEDSNQTLKEILEVLKNKFSQ